MATHKIKRNDDVKVISGRFRHHIGVVVAVDGDYVKVSGANCTKAVKPNPQKDIKGGLLSVPAKIHRSNVVLFDKAAEKAIKVGIKVVDGKRVRVDRKTGETIEDKV